MDTDIYIDELLNFLKAEPEKRINKGNFKIKQLTLTPSFQGSNPCSPAKGAVRSRCTGRGITGGISDG
jgi:hypothetical protein